MRIINELGMNNEWMTCLNMKHWWITEVKGWIINEWLVLAWIIWFRDEYWITGLGMNTEWLV